MWFDIPTEDLFLEALEDGGDPILLSLMNPPGMLPVLEQILGDPRLCGVQARTTPANDGIGGYSSFHRDDQQAPVDNIIRPRGRVLKAFVYIFDCGEDQGPTSIVPVSNNSSYLFHLNTWSKWM